MKINNWIRKQVKKKIFSRQPHPVIPFILIAIIFILTIYSKAINPGFFIFMIAFFIFSFIFAVLHFYVWLVTKRE